MDYFLEPGHIYFSKRAAVVRTVVGSCVAVCIWDTLLKYGGMNHFLKPSTKDASKATPRYGNVATAALVKMMDEAGCDRRNLVAQILGGACPKNSKEAFENIKVARGILNKKGITILSEDTGGSIGRKVAFDTDTGQVAILKVHKIRDTDWL